MRVELLFDLEKPSLPADNRAIFVSFLKKTLEQSHEGYFFERYFGGTARKDYSFSIILDKPRYEGERIQLKTPRLKMIFSADDRNQTGLIFSMAFMGMKYKKFPLPEHNSMTLKRIVHVKEDVIISNRVMFRTIPGSGLVVREHFRETNRDKYYVIGEEQFEEKAQQSLVRQALEAGFSKGMAEKIKFQPVSGKKVVSRLYGIMIDVSAITFIVEADSMILQYFYQAGLSSRTSIGYGLSAIIEQL